MQTPRILVTSLYDFPSSTLEGRLLSIRIRPLSFLADVDFYCPRDELISHTEKIDAHFRVYRVPVQEPSPPVRIEALARAVKRQLNSEEYAVIHVRSPWEMEAVLSMKDVHEGLLVYEVPLVPYGIMGDPARQKAYDQLQATALKEADLVIVSNSYTFKYLEEVHGSKVRFAPVGVMIDVFDDYGVAPMYDVVWNVDDLAGPELEFMLSVLEHAVQLEESLVILVAGRFSQLFEAEMTHQLQRRGLWRNVRLMRITSKERLGFLTSLARVGLVEPVFDTVAYAWPDLSLKGMEYLAAGVPPLVPDQPYYEIVHEGLADAYDPGEVKTTAERVVWMVNHAGETAWRVKKAREVVRKRFNAGDARRYMLDIYRELLGSVVEGTEPAERDTARTSISWDIPMDEVTPIQEIGELDFDLDLDDLQFESDAPLLSPKPQDDDED